MSMTDLQIKIAAEAAYIAANKQLVQLQDFAHTYSEAETMKGASILVPVYDLSAAGTFNSSSNNYASGVDETGRAEIILSSHLVKSVACTDRDMVETDTQWVRDAGTGIANVLAKGVHGTVMGLLNGTNIDLSAEFDATTAATKANVAALYETADTNGLNIAETVVILKPAVYAKVLSHLDSNVYGGQDAIVNGRIPGLYGFKAFMCASDLADGVTGVMVESNALGIASRYLPPMTGAYPTVFKSVDPTTGFTLGFREFADLASGTRYLAGECLFGAKIINKNRMVKLLAST